MRFPLRKRCNRFIALHHSLLNSLCAQADLCSRLGFKARGYFPKILHCINVASFVLRDTGATGRVIFLSTLSDMNAPLVDLPPVNLTGAQ